MKKTFAVLLLAGITYSSTAQQSNEEPFMTKSLSSESVNSATAKTTGGNISVEGVDAQARIEVYVKPGNSKDKNLSKADLQKRLDEDYDLNVSVSNHVLTAVAKSKKNNINWNRSLSISFKIYIPRNSSTNLSTSGGNINLSSLSGKQDFTTSGGNLNITHVSGNVKGRTSGGNINVSDANDEVDLGTSGGNITAENAKGKIKLTTSGGSLKLTSLQGTIKATTSGGNVTGQNIAGELAASTSGGNIRLSALTCSLETSTSGGNIDVDITSLGKYLTVSNSGGNIDIQMPQDKGVTLKLYADKIKVSTLSNFKGDIEKDRIEGTLGDGGIPVTVHGSSGKINLTLK
jgi:hypothetical protein